MQLSVHVSVHFAFGGRPEQGSGAWGAFAKATEGTAKLFGKSAALKALKEGEEHGIHSYEGALKGEDLPVECRKLISDKLLPQTRAHVDVLNQLLEMK